MSIDPLRKSYTYFLKTIDVHVTTAAKLLGHVELMVTLKIYRKVQDCERDDIGE